MLRESGAIRSIGNRAEPGRPQRTIRTGRAIARRLARRGRRQPAHLADLSTGLCADLWRSGEFGSAHRSAFLTNNFDGFSVDFAANSYKNFVNAQPQVTVDLRTRSGSAVQFGGPGAVEKSAALFRRRCFRRSAVHRDDESLSANPATERGSPGIDTAAFVERSEFAPRVVVPLRWGPVARRDDQLHGRGPLFTAPNWSPVRWSERSAAPHDGRAEHRSPASHARARLANQRAENGSTRSSRKSNTTTWTA